MIVVLEVDVNKAAALVAEFKGHGFPTKEVYAASCLESAMKEFLSTQEYIMLQQMASASGLSVAAYIATTVKQSVAKREVFNYQPTTTD